MSIQTAAQLIAEEIKYSKLTARLLATFVDKEVANQDIHSFSQSIAAGLRAGLMADRTAVFVAGLPSRDMRAYLEFIADQRLAALKMQQLYGAKNSLSFMNLQDVQELTNFFERRASAYQIGNNGECGVAVGKPDCWCFSQPVLRGVLQRLPLQMGGAACVCRPCVMSQNALERALGQIADVLRRR